jgi:hypothetical protein
LRPSQSSKSGKQQKDVKEKVDNAELDWKLCHSNFAEIILQMQQLMRLISESHVSQQLAAHRCVQKEKIMRILAEAQLQERDEMHAAHAEAYKLLDQRHEDLRERYIELCSSMNMYACMIAQRAVSCVGSRYVNNPLAGNPALIKRACLCNNRSQLVQWIQKAATRGCNPNKLVLLTLRPDICCKKTAHLW